MNQYQSRNHPLTVKVLPCHRPNIEDYMNKRFEEELHQFPEHAHNDLRCVLNCLHNYERFHCAGDIRTMPIPPLIKQRVPGENVQVTVDSILLIIVWAW